MKQFIAIFSKPIVLPGNEMEKVKAYGLLFNKTEKATIENVTNYIRNYVFVIAELFRDGVENIGDWTYKKDAKVFNVNGSYWWDYAEKAKKKKIQFELVDDDNVEICKEEYYDDFLLTSKERWVQLKAMPIVV